MTENLKAKIHARKIFNSIAPVYSMLHNSIVSNFLNAASVLNAKIDLTGKNVLDIGTGTGAWSHALIKKGASYVHGIDISEKMIGLANKKKHRKQSFAIADAEKLVHIKDKSFDIVTASFVLHGFKTHYRKNVLKEMKRISKSIVIIHDYSGKTPLIPRFLEYLEKSDYIHFKSNICDELSQNFNKVEKKQIKNGTALYFSYT